MTSTKQVNMDVVDSLAAIVSGVDDGAVALCQSPAARKLRSHPVQMADQGAILFGCMRNRGDVFARTNQHVHRRLWVDVGQKRNTDRPGRRPWTGCFLR
jgi:hypothetical protein